MGKHQQGLSLKKKIDVPSGRITSIAVTDNGFIMCNDMLDNFKDNVIAYTETGEKSKSCTVSNRVYGIAIIPNTDEAVVSLPEAKIIQFVNLSSMMTGRQLQVTIKDMFMYGIAVVCDTLIVSGSSGNVYFIEKIKGKCLKSFTIGTGSICSFLPIISAGSAAPFKTSAAPSLTNDWSAYTGDWSASADDWSAVPAATTRTTNWGGNSAEDWSASADDWSVTPATKAHSPDWYGSSAENW
ncbi:unnamed protein product [Mytilus edulis]|uniref:Uncharacterized protein n=1 Tax=Mytilus edulis TaxID=6550 RepID=A0A8S3VH06_MYTED|nr:unnamed protein product [Mytilus edulis]